MIRPSGRTAACRVPLFLAGSLVVAAVFGLPGSARTSPASAAGALAASSTDECRGPAHAPPASPPPGFTGHMATIDGVQMHYVLGGSGKQVIVLLHGWPEDWYEWRDVMPDLARDYTVAAVDLPGLGDSRGSPPAYDAKTLATFVHRLVVDHLGFRHVHLVGHDFGAGVAFAYAAFFRDAASTLTMMEFPLPGPGTDEQQLRAQLWWFGFHDVAQLPEEMVQGRQLTYLSWFYDNLVSPSNRIDATAVTEYVRTYCIPSVLHGGFQLYRELPADASENSSVTANKLTLPILLMSAVRGSDPAAEKAQLIATVQPMASGPISAELVPDSGHFVAEENPQFVVAQLGSFIDANAVDEGPGGTQNGPSGSE